MIIEQITLWPAGIATFISLVFFAYVYVVIGVKEISEYLRM